MGAVIRFPLEERMSDGPRAGISEPASVIILPVIRIERHMDEPTGTPGAGKSSGRRRRGRATRS